MLTLKGDGPAGVIRDMAAALRTAAAEAGVETASLDGLGVGSPGDVESAEGTVANAYNVVPEWNGPVRMAELLQEATGAARVALGNDVRVATTAEFRLGAGKPYGSILGVFWGTGVGGGVILNGKPWRGRGAAGEIGYMVVCRNGVLCICGWIGCMEVYSGWWVMEIEARSRVDKGYKTI